jgi:2-iminoacetate synthase
LVQKTEHLFFPKLDGYYLGDEKWLNAISMSFYQRLQSFNWDEITASIALKSAREVEMALNKQHPDLEDFKALVSPAADAYLEPMAQKSHRLTCQRFGKVVQLYIPLYLSNYCENRCVYCGFSGANKLKRKVLSMAELEQEARVIRKNPYRHILLVTGEAPSRAGVDYLAEAIQTLNPYFSQVSLEVQPMETADYARLVKEGLHGVSVYQETYNEKTYPDYHPFGKKADFLFRLETPERLGRAGVRKIGLGSLIGLEDWRTEAWFTALHLQYLRRQYWQTKYSVSFPRLRPFAGEGFQPRYETTERNLTQLIVAYRLLDNDLELSLSTRERPHFRDHVFPLGITSMSAGSKTGPGGYSDSGELEQFAVNDDRSPQVVAERIRSMGFEPVWKDWSLCLQQDKAI